jgi:hypothetical protein
MRLLPDSTRRGHFVLGAGLLILAGLFIAIILVLALAASRSNEVRVASQARQVAMKDADRRVAIVDEAKEQNALPLQAGAGKKAKAAAKQQDQVKLPEVPELPERELPDLPGRDPNKKLAPAKPSAPIAVNGEPVREGNCWRFRVQGEFRPSVDSARESALRTAQEHIRDWLAKQETPIHHVPSIETIRTRMSVNEIARQEEQILNQSDRMYKMTVAVDLRPELMRELRERDRVGLGVWAFGGVVGILGLVVLLFRVDEWTKGYLTRLLMVGGVVVGVAAVVIWLWRFGD